VSKDRNDFQSAKKPDVGLKAKTVPISRSTGLQLWNVECFMQQKSSPMIAHRAAFFTLI
jgi:hypothetical protein